MIGSRIKLKSLATHLPQTNHFFMFFTLEDNRQPFVQIPVFFLSLIAGLTVILSIFLFKFSYIFTMSAFQLDYSRHQYHPITEEPGLLWGLSFPKSNFSKDAWAKREVFCELALNYLPNNVEVSGRFCTLHDLLLSAFPVFNTALI